MTSPADTGGLLFRAHDGTDRAGRAALDALLFEIFGLDLGPLDALGGRDPSYRSFSHFDARGRCVANASVCAMPLVVKGRTVEAVGVQSVAVRPELRGRGLFRDLMQRLLAWIDERAPLALLTTTTPALYRRFGFHVAPEHRIVGAAPDPAPGVAPARRLDLAADLALVKRLLDDRVPISDLLGLRHFGAMFLMNLAAMPHLRLDHLGEEDAIVVSDPSDPGTVRLLDIVGRRIPSLATVIGALGIRPARVEIGFPADRIGFSGDAVPAGKPTALMARGRFLEPSAPFMLPRTAAF